MNPWELLLNVLGWGMLAIVALILTVTVIVLLRAIPSLWRKPPSKTTNIFKSSGK